MRLIITVTLVVFLATPAAAQTHLAGVARAKDGDSLSISGISVRLHGIDAPEFTQPCNRQGKPWNCGEEAKQQLATLLAGQHVACRRIDTDEFGRAVAICSAGGREINKALVESGWATAFRKYSTAYIADEERARAAGLGIWGSSFEPPSDFRHRTEARQIIDQRPRTAQPQRFSRPAPAHSGGCAIKGNHSRKGELIYHLPGMPYYAETRAEQMFCSEAEARAAGYRRSRARP